MFDYLGFLFVFGRVNYRKMMAAVLCLSDLEDEEFLILGYLQPSSTSPSTFIPFILEL